MGRTNVDSPRQRAERRGAGLTALDDGTGPALYAGGLFSAGGVAVPAVAKWNGQTWMPVGNGLALKVVGSLVVFDDGSGPALYTGGFIDVTHPGGVARWDGTAWTSVG